MEPSVVFAGLLHWPSCRFRAYLHACRDPVKGVAALIGSGTVDSSPGAVAAFLRAHLPELDRTQLGEYFGHHDKLAVSGLRLLALHVTAETWKLYMLLCRAKRHVWSHLMNGDMLRCRLL